MEEYVSDNTEIIKVNDKQIPTIIAYDFDKQQLIIGKDARIESLKGNSNIYNFKLDLGQTDSFFREKKKYWYAIPYADGKRGVEKHETFTPKEIITRYISNLIQDVPLPEELMVGVPAITDKKWSERFRRHMREVFEDISKEVGGDLKPQFFPEPFAIFQYYRHIEKAFEAKGTKENILVIDIGAGTFNSCIIQTTSEGYLSRSGVNQHPLGLYAEEKGGFFLDKEIVKHLVNKAKERGVAWKEDPLSRIGSSKIPILLLVEDAKIQLSSA